MSPLHAALAAYGGTTGNAALATEAMADDMEASSESGSASVEGVGEWGVTVIDASDGGSETEHREAVIEVDYDIGDGTDPTVVANVLHAIASNEAQLSHEPIPTLDRRFCVASRVERTRQPLGAVSADRPWPPSLPEARP
jgi:hypothetical protein